MLGTKYLSQLVTPDMLVRDKLNIIKAPTGSGKTYFALTAIPAMLKDAVHKVVYLIDTMKIPYDDRVLPQRQVIGRRIALKTCKALAVQVQPILVQDVPVFVIQVC